MRAVLVQCVVALNVPFLSKRVAVAKSDELCPVAVKGIEI